MRLGIIGIGGIGGYFGTKLIQRYGTDHWVGFLQRGRHLEAIRDSGLYYLTRDHRYHVRPQLATDRPEELGRIDLAIVAVKSYDLEPTLKSLSPCLGQGSLLITALNGVNIAPRCRKVLPHTTVLPGCIYLSAHVESPGVVRQVGGVGNFYFGAEDGDVWRYGWLEQLLSGAGIKAVLDPEISSRLWEKYLFVSALATATAAHGRSIGEIVGQEDTRQEVVCLMKEIMALARAEGVVLAEGLIAKNLRLAETIPPQTRTSLQLDIEAGRRAELDIFTEYVIQRSQELGLECPGHLRLYDFIKRRRENR